MSNVSKLLSHLSKRHAGVAEEDAGHAAAAPDIYRPPDQRRAEGLDQSLSMPEAAVYRRPGAWWKSRRRLHESANRGDAKTDALRAVGKLRDTDRWKHTATHARELKKVLGEYSLTGHSLGGTLALAHCSTSTTRCLKIRGAWWLSTLARPYSRPSPGATLLGPIPGRDGRVYATRGDTVSALSYATHKDVRVLAPSEGSDLAGAYGVSNFTNT